MDMMTPIHPIAAALQDFPNRKSDCQGMCICHYAAFHAMLGLLSANNNKTLPSPTELATQACDYAEALTAELTRRQQL